MLQDKYQKVFIALAALIILALGTLFGNYLLSKLSVNHIDSIAIGLSFTTIIISLITFSMVIEIKDAVAMQKTKR